MKRLMFLLLSLFIVIPCYVMLQKLNTNSRARKSSILVPSTTTSAKLSAASYKKPELSHKKFNKLKYYREGLVTASLIACAFCSTGFLLKPELGLLRFGPSVFVSSALPSFSQYSIMNDVLYEIEYKNKPLSKKLLHKINALDKINSIVTGVFLSVYIAAIIGAGPFRDYGNFEPQMLLKYFFISGICLHLYNSLTEIYLYRRLQALGKD